MDDRSFNLVMQVVREQLEFYLTDDLADEIADGIYEGLKEIQPVLEEIE